MKKTTVVVGLLCCWFLCLLVRVAPAQALPVIPALRQGAFPLVREGVVPAVWIDTADERVVAIAAGALASDLALVSGSRPAVVHQLRNSDRFLVIAGTIGHSAAIDQLVAAKKLDVSRLRGKWESFNWAVVEAPVPGVQQALVIAGSDPRGTAYGLLELSRSAGVSPWVWWADALPQPQRTLSVLPGVFCSAEPSVKYRGIFLNDEDWGLQPWAARTFEPETGDIGPKTYARIFELLLRLRANLIWPAMHPCTRAFFHYPGNEKMAADYAILIGTSHAEPMLRNNVDEWNEKTMGHFNYLTNKDSVYRYWESRVMESRGIQAIYTLGMRGIHDSGMEGIKDPKQAVPLLQRIFDDQRGLLSQYIRKEVTAVPQVFTAYKEVLDIYDNGLKLPDDVTLVWPDDNYGYIHRLNNEAEKQRPGGSGVYYHISYWGRPHDYLWLGTTHPALIQEEMMKAYQNGSNRLWVVNVGDIKPAEYLTELFLDMAYRAEPFTKGGYARQHLHQWLGGLFGKKKAAALHPVLWDYYQLAYERRPEFMGWSQTEPTTKTSYTQFNHFDHGDEAAQRLQRYAALERQVKSIRQQLNARDTAAFYQLVYYPVVGASWMNRKFLYRDKQHFYAAQHRASAADYARLSAAAYDSIRQETAYYNTRLSGGKWKGMLSMKPRELPVFQALDNADTAIGTATGWGIAPEGGHNQDPAIGDSFGGLQLPAFDPLNRQQYFIDLFLKDDQPLNWTASVSAPWIVLSRASGRLSNDFGEKELRLSVQIDWRKAPLQAENTGRIVFSGNGQQVVVTVTARRRTVPGGFSGWIENNGYVSIKAGQPTRQVNRGNGNWQPLPGLGYAGLGMQSGNVAEQDSAHGQDTAWIRKNGSYLVYDFYTFSPGRANLTVFSVPTHPLHTAFRNRYAVSVDEGPLQVVDFRTFGRSEEWKQHVLRNRAEKTVAITFLDKGRHQLKLYSIDPGVVLDAILVDLGGLKKAYGLVRETRLAGGQGKR